MNPILIDYILNVLAPSEYKLELKNRLENLCSLSGTPMSPGLSAWLTKTFGLEMTRVVQDYSTFSSPKFSPELQERINRVVPSNYQGYDANLGFNQLFDVSCAPPCDNFRYAIIGNYNGTGFGFGGWTINGLPFDLGLPPNYQVEVLAAGCFTNVPYTNAGQPFDAHEIIIWYYGDGSNDPVLDILNDIGDPVVLNWKNICTKTCYEAIFYSGATLIYGLNPMGAEFAVTVQPFNTFFAGYPDVSVPANVAAIEAYYKQCCGAATTVTSTVDLNGDYVVRINNAYIPIIPAWDTNAGSIYFNGPITCP